MLAFLVQTHYGHFDKGNRLGCSPLEDQDNRSTRLSSLKGGWGCQSFQRSLGSWYQFWSNFALTQSPDSHINFRDTARAETTSRLRASRVQMLYRKDPIDTLFDTLSTIACRRHPSKGISPSMRDTKPGLLSGLCGPG